MAKKRKVYTPEFKLEAIRLLESSMLTVSAVARDLDVDPGCNHTRFLEIHHIVSRSEGGNNDLNNLKLLCSSCHSLVHRSQYLVGEESGSYRYGELFLHEYCNPTP